MNSRLAIAAASAVVLSAAAYILLGDYTVPRAHESTGADAGSKGAGESRAEAVAVTTGNTSTKRGVNWDLLNALAGGTNSNNFSLPKPTAQDIGRFLSKHGESAPNLIAAWRYTQDRQWLNRALERFPKNPMVLLSALQALPADPEPMEGEEFHPNGERLSLIERLKDADPKNPLPWVFAAQQLFKAKDLDGAMAEVRAALERPAFYTYATEEADAGQRLYESLGLGPLEASIASMYGITMPHAHAAMQASRSLMDFQKQAAEAGNAAASDEAMRLTYGLGRMFATPESSRFLIGQLVGNSMEKRVLDALPPNSRPEWLDVSREERILELEKQKQAVKRAVADSEWILQTRDEVLIADYVRLVRTQGELAAQNYIRERKDAAGAGAGPK